MNQTFFSRSLGPLAMSMRGTFRTKRTSSKIPPLPDPEYRVKDGILKRFNSNHEWKERRLVLTSQDILFTLVGHDNVIEKIPLVSRESYFFTTNKKVITILIRLVCIPARNPPRGKDGPRPSLARVCVAFC